MGSSSCSVSGSVSVPFKVLSASHIGFLRYLLIPSSLWCPRPPRGDGPRMAVSRGSLIEQHLARLDGASTFGLNKPTRAEALQVGVAAGARIAGRVADGVARDRFGIRSHQHLQNF